MPGGLLPPHLPPLALREVGALVPMRCYQLALRRVIERGGGFVEVALPTATMCLIFAGLLALIRWRMKPRLG
jgi:hypothetical protein